MTELALRLRVCDMPYKNNCSQKLVDESRGRWPATAMLVAGADAVGGSFAMSRDLWTGIPVVRHLNFRLGT